MNQEPNLATASRQLELYKTLGVWFSCLLVESKQIFVSVISWNETTECSS